MLCCRLNRGWYSEFLIPSTRSPRKRTPRLEVWNDFRYAHSTRTAALTSCLASCASARPRRPRRGYSSSRPRRRCWLVWRRKINLYLVSMSWLRKGRPWYLREAYLLPTKSCVMLIDIFTSSVLDSHTWYSCDVFEMLFFLCWIEFIMNCVVLSADTSRRAPSALFRVRRLRAQIRRVHQSVGSAH